MDSEQSNDWIYQVIINDQEQYSIGRIWERWTDMRPLSVWRHLKARSIAG
jgi:uncharacterized protein YbdZ (MbtH family)